MRQRVFADEDALPEDKLADHIVAWPGKWPKGTRAPMRPGREPATPRRPRAEDSWPGAHFLRNPFWPAALGVQGGDPRAPRPRRRPDFSPGQRFLPNSGRGRFFLGADSSR